MIKSIVAAVAALTLGAGLMLGEAGGARAASGDSRTVVRGPVHCTPVHCTQKRSVVIHRHGSLPETIISKRSRPVESRSPYAPRVTPPWGRWHVVSVS